MLLDFMINKKQVYFEISNFTLLSYFLLSCTHYHITMNLFTFKTENNHKNYPGLFSKDLQSNKSCCYKPTLKVSLFINPMANKQPVFISWSVGIELRNLTYGQLTECSLRAASWMATMCVILYLSSCEESLESL